jgi:hypothetical protein
MKQLRWQILVVIITLAIVGVLLYTQQSSPATGGVILQQPEQGAYTPRRWSGRLAG